MKKQKSLSTREFPKRSNPSDRLSQDKYLPETKKEVIKMKAQVKKKDIGMIGFIIDIFDGYANIRTLNAHKGEIEFWVSPDFLEDFKSLVRRLKNFFKYNKKYHFY